MSLAEEINYLSQFLTEERKNRIEEILANRTNYLTVVLEDIFQPHNASACLRTTEGFGFQKIHIIENRNTYRLNPDIALGADKWIDLKRYNQFEQNTPACFSNLKKANYQIVGTSLSEEAIDLRNLKIDKKTAIVFGTEETGLSPYALKNVDVLAKLPMYGFTQSYNISVTLAMCLFWLKEMMFKNNIEMQLSDERKQNLRKSWYLKSIPKGDKVYANYLKRQQVQNKTIALNNLKPLNT